LLSNRPTLSPYSCYTVFSINYHALLLRIIFGPKRNEVTGDWRELHNEELYDLYSNYYAGDQIEKNEMGGACSMYRGLERVYRVLVGKSEGNRTRGRPRRRWEDNIKMDLQEVGCESMDWVDLT
jgi:hypothetical protein